MRGSDEVYRDLKVIPSFLYSVPLLGVVLFVFSIGFPPFDDATTLDLTTHMIEHILIVIAGIMVAYPLHKKGHFRSIESKPSAYLSLMIMVVVITVWHLPSFWDGAVLDPAIHAVEHLSFFGVGIFIGSTLQLLSDRAKIDVLLLGFFGHFGYGLVLISPYKVYPLYSLGDQAVLGIVMFSVGPFYWTGILYLLYRNRAWFKEVSMFGEPGEHASPPRVDAPPSPRPSRRRALSAVTPLATVSLVVVLIAFYSFSAAAIAFTPQPPQQSGSTQVLILETPVTWAFSPKNITVVIGVNSTVTWVSHSTAFDTVTATDGSFDSGSIAPGKTFTFTFTRPGSFAYECVYHPWMVGSVRVLPGR